MSKTLRKWESVGYIRGRSQHLISSPLVRKVINKWKRRGYMVKKKKIGSAIIILAKKG